jgi:hypothetical protein
MPTRQRFRWQRSSPTPWTGVAMILAADGAYNTRINGEIDNATGCRWIEGDAKRAQPRVIDTAREQRAWIRSDR